MRKIRRHRILDIPVLGPVIGGLVTLLIAESIIGGIGYVLIDQIRYQGQMVASPYFSAVGGILMLLLYKWWFQGEFRGTLNGNYGDRTMKILLLISVIVDLLFLAFAYITEGMQAPSIEILGISLMAGICEEVSFRGVSVSLAMRRAEGKKGIVIAMVSSVLAFVLIHLFNIAAGQSVGGTLVQLVSCIGFGIFFGAIYLRTGNLLISMVWHFAHDFLAQMQSTAEGGIVDSASLTSFLSNLLLSGILAVLGIALIYGHAQEIEAIWEDRWKKKE